MSQPKWKLVGNLGDVDVFHGSRYVFEDTTGVYPPEMEIISPFTDKGIKWEVSRIVLEPHTFINGVLSENKFHPEYPAWYANKLDNVAASCGTSVNEIISLLTAPEALKRAEGYGLLYDHFGPQEFGDDMDVITTEKELRKRYDKYGKQKAPN